MTENRSTTGGQAPDLGTIAADTLLLDSLGRGEPAPAGDPVAGLLAAWRADLDVDLDAVLDVDLDTDLDAAAITDLDTDLDAAATTDPDTDLEPAGPATGVPGGAPADRRRRYRMARRALGTAAAVLLVGGGLIAGAGQATPGSPLWPITRVMYPERADNAAAEHTLGLAREAATEGRADDARRLLAQAETQIARVSDAGRAQRLRAELKTVRGMLPAAAPDTSAPGVPTSVPSGPAVRTGPAAPTTAGPAPVPTGAAPPGVVPTGPVPAPRVPNVRSPGLPTAGSNVPKLPVLPTGSPLPTLLPGGGLLPPPLDRVLPVVP
jgi:hypothetical protein